LGLICGKLCHRNVTAENGVYFRVNEKMLAEKMRQSDEYCRIFRSHSHYYSHTSGTSAVDADDEPSLFRGCALPMLSVDSARYSSENQPDFVLFIGAKLYKSEPAEICLDFVR